MDNNGFIQELYDRGCIKTKNSKLHIDLKLTIGYTNLLYYISNCFKEKAETLAIDAIIGAPYFGIIHASYLSCKINKPLCVIKNEKVVQRELIDPENIINRNTESGHDGKKKLNILVVVDSIEKGFKLANFIYNIHRRIRDCNIIGIFTICDNQIASNKYLNLSKYYIYSVINTHDILNYLIQFNKISSQEFLKIYNTMDFNKINRNRNVLNIKNNNLAEKIISIIKLKKTNLLVSLYYTNFFHIVNVVNKISQLVCGIVINTNIIEQFSDEKAELLKKLAYEKKIIIVNNVQLLFNNKVIVNKTLTKLFTFSDLVTINIKDNNDTELFRHFNLDLLKTLKDNNRGFIMNMKGNGYNNSFINQRIIELVSKYNKYLLGILCDKRDYFMKDDNMLYFSDKIDLIENTVQEAVLQFGIDVVIFDVVEFKNLTKEYIESISKSVKTHRDCSWVSFCKVNTIEN
jgi:orotate phosphoribosyltransferase